MSSKLSKKNVKGKSPKKASFPPTMAALPSAQDNSHAKYEPIPKTNHNWMYDDESTNQNEIPSDDNPAFLFHDGRRDWIMKPCVVDSTNKNNDTSIPPKRWSKLKILLVCWSLIVLVTLIVVGVFLVQMKPSTPPPPSTSSDDQDRTSEGNEKPTILQTQNYVQTYYGPNLQTMTTDQIQQYQTFLAGYTKIFRYEPDHPITSKCKLQTQFLAKSRERKHNIPERMLQTNNLKVSFTMMYASQNATQNDNETPSNYQDLFLQFMNSDTGKDLMKTNLQSVDLNVELVDDLMILEDTLDLTIAPTPAPTTEAPSQSPVKITSAPTLKETPCPTKNTVTEENDSCWNLILFDICW